jgi:hypothetical protein
MGRHAAPVWCNPRQHEETYDHSRPQSEAGPDECESGGTNPRIAAGSTVGCDWLRLFECTKVKKRHEDLQKLRPTLDIGSHINGQA